MTKFFSTFFFLIIVSATITAQVGINTASPDASAALDVQSTTQGMLVPRMSEAQRTAIASPANGLLVYQTDATAGFYFYNGTAWASLSGGGSGDNLGNHAATQTLNMGNNNITSANTITSSKLNTSEISIGSTSTVVSLNNLNGTSSEIDATGKTFIRISTNISSTNHVICGIAGGYDGKILYLFLNSGFTWASNSTVETNPSNRLANTLITPFTQNTTSSFHIIKLVYLSWLFSGEGRWVVMDQDL